MRKEKVRLNLECVIGDEKLREYSKELAEKTKELGRLEATKSSYNKQIGADISMAEAKIAGLADKVATGKEFNEVDCTVKYHWDDGTKTVTRNDTLETVAEEPITDDELQEQLALQEKNAKAESKKKP